MLLETHGYVLARTQKLGYVDFQVRQNNALT